MYDIEISGNGNCNPYTIPPSNSSSPRAYKEGGRIFTISPNPATDKVVLRADSDLDVGDKYRMSIYNVLGNKIQEYNIDQSSIAIDVNEFDSGVYLYQISVNTELLLSDKFIKID